MNNEKKKRRSVVDLKGHERNYNALFDELQRNVPSFDRNKISNGEFCFHEFIKFLKKKNLYNEFKEFVKEENDLEKKLNNEDHSLDSVRYFEKIF